MDLESAIRKHSEWKIRLRGAIFKKETLDAATISQDNCCELGKWLHGEARTKFGRLASHAECIKKHAAFHTEAGKVASTINGKRYTEAEAMMGGDTSYAQVSSSVAIAIMHLKKEAGL
jgi:hypothetical protein